MCIYILLSDCPFSTDHPVLSDCCQSWCPGFFWAWCTDRDSQGSASAKCSLQLAKMASCKAVHFWHHLSWLYAWCLCVSPDLRQRPEFVAAEPPSPLVDIMDMINVHSVKCLSFAHICFCGCLLIATVTFHSMPCLKWQQLQGYFVKILFNCVPCLEWHGAVWSELGHLAQWTTTDWTVTEHLCMAENCA